MNSNNCARCIALRSINMTCGSTKAAIAIARPAQAEQVRKKYGTDRFGLERALERTRLYDCLIDNEASCDKKKRQLPSPDAPINLDNRMKQAAAKFVDEAAAHAGVIMTATVVVMFFRCI